MQSPVLPWEVIERVVSHSGDHPKTIRNFSLTCRDLRPRSLCFLVADATFKGREQIFDFCDFLQANPHLKPFVRSIAVDPNHFAPVPLFNVLPNLPSITFTSPRSKHTVSSIVLHQSTLTGCQCLGTHIQTLRLSKLLFTTPLDFARALSAFTNVIHLVCTAVFVKAEGRPSRAPLEVMRRRLSGRMRLQTLTVDFDYVPLHWQVPKDSASAGALLLDWGLALSTAESLTVAVRQPFIFPQSSNWSPSRLRSLVLNLDFYPSCIAHGIALLQKFRGSLPTLKEVLVEVCQSSISVMMREISFHPTGRSGSSNQYQELEDTLLQFSQPQIIFQVDKLPAGSNLFRTQELEKLFPMLSERSALTVSSGRTAIHAGHESEINALVASPDGTWVASGSQDGTIILWDVGTGNGKIARQWSSPNYEIVLSLAFSPDSGYLVSGDTDGRAVIWDLSEGSRKPTVLEGHTDSVDSCAWSPSGDMIATGSSDETVRLWDAHTFQLLSVLEDACHKIRVLMFSPTGHWLFSGCIRFYYTWDVASHIPHKPLCSPDHDDGHGSPLTAAFDSESSRLFVASQDDVPKIFDVEAGAELISFGTSASAAAFSQDGKLVVTGSEDGAMKIWDAYTGVELLLLEGHTNGVRKACFSPCGRYIASGSQDHTVRLWRTRDGSCVATFSEHDDDVQQVAFSPDGKTLSSASGDYSGGTVITRRMCDIIPADELDL